MKKRNPLMNMQTETVSWLYSNTSDFCDTKHSKFVLLGIQLAAQSLAWYPAGCTKSCLVSSFAVQRVAWYPAVQLCKGLRPQRWVVGRCLHVCCSCCLKFSTLLFAPHFNELLSLIKSSQIYIICLLSLNTIDQEIRKYPYFVFRHLHIF